MVPTQDLTLLEDLHRVELSIIFLLDEEHLTVGTLADDGEHPEVGLADLACLALLSVDHVLIRLHFLILGWLSFHRDYIFA